MKNKIYVIYLLLGQDSMCTVWWGTATLRSVEMGWCVSTGVMWLRSELSSVKETDAHLLFHVNLFQHLDELSEGN